MCSSPLVLFYNSEHPSWYICRCIIWAFYVVPYWFNDFIGRMFEGSAETMLASIKKVMELPKTTLVFPGECISACPLNSTCTYYCCNHQGHEYSQKNLQFANHLMPASAAVWNKLQWVNKQRAAKLTTVGMPCVWDCMVNCLCPSMQVPSVLSEELQYNLFMHSHSCELKNALGLSLQSSEAQVLSKLRKRKNDFK